MIWKNYKYKWIDFSESLQKLSKENNWYYLMLTSDLHTTALNTTITDRANYHGGYTSETLAWPRLYTFEWQIYGSNQVNRSIAWNQLIAAIQPEWNPADRWFYDLEYEDWEGTKKAVKAKVFSAPEEIPSNKPCDVTFNFRFELQVETEKIDWDTLTTVSWWVWIIWWVPFATTFPNTFTWYGWAITCTNNWNRTAPVKIAVIWSIVNPKIINLTNGEKYRITKTTTNLIFDNRNVDNDPTKRLIVTDAGVDIRWYRSSWASIFLDPWVNQLVIIWDSYDPATVVNISFKDSRLY